MIRVFLRNGYACFHVVDNGRGMSKEKCQQVRESLKEFQVHSIGLANVNNRLRLYYGETGSIRVLSREGHGTALSFHIPLEKADEPS